MFKFTILLLFIFLLISPSYAAKYALLIGINDYVNMNEEDGDLGAPENDVKFMKEVLVKKFGFDNKNIITLISREATKKNIKKAFFNLLVDKCKTGDTALFYFSGHGTQFDDINGDEPDGIDEGLCPADIDDYSIDNYIVDDEFGEWISRVKTDNFTIILDSCFSGTATRGINKWEGGPKIKFHKNKICKGVPKGKNKDRAFESGKENYTFISGCREDQFSMEDTFVLEGDEENSFRAGVLTVNLIYNFYNASSADTYEEVMEKTISDIKTLGYEQVPQLYGNYKRSVFGTPSVNNSAPDNPETVIVDSGKKKSYFIINSVNGNNIELGAGSGNKLATGSTFEVYPPGEEDFTGKGTGIIQITSVSLLFSEGKIIEGTVQKNGRAVQITETCKTSSLRIFIDKDIDNIISKELKKIDYISIEKTPQICDRIISGKFSNGKVNIVLHTRDGREIAVGSGTPAEAVKSIRPYLDNAYAIKELSKLSNPRPDFNIKLWTDKGYIPSYNISDNVTFNFKSDKTCYLTLIDISTDGQVTILFPNKYNSNNMIEKGKIYSIPSEGMGFKIKVTGPPGDEMVKAIATDVPVDISRITPENISNGFRSMTGSNGGSDYLRSIPDILLTSLEKDRSIKKDAITLKGWSTEELIITIEK